MVKPRMSSPSPERVCKLLDSKRFAKLIKSKLLAGQAHEFVDEPRHGFRRNSKVSIFDSDGEEAYFFRRDAFVTGGAVAAVVFEHIYGTKAVINDIDIFYYDMDTGNQEAAAKNLYENLGGEINDYRLGSVEEIGKLNLIKVIPDLDFRWSKLLDSFDLNYSQIGIVMADDEFVYTEHFVDWIISKTIRLTEKFEDEYPITSYLRGVHKSRDYQCASSIKEEIKSYLAWQAPDVVWHPDGDKKIPLVTSRATATKMRKLQSSSECVELVTVKRLKYWRDNPECLSPLLTLAKGEDTILVNIPDEPWAQFVRLYKSTCPSRDRIAFSNDVLNKNKAFYSKLCALVRANVLYDVNSWDRVLEKNERCLSNEFSLARLEAVSTFFNQHDALRITFLDCLLFWGWDVRKAVDFFARLAKLELHDIGVVESMQLEERLRGRPTGGVVRQQLLAHLREGKTEQFFAQLKAINKEDASDDMLAIPLKTGPFKSRVRELFKRSHLNLEGTVMHHCISGFSQAVLDRRSRIFHLKIGNFESTLELLLTEVNQRNWKSTEYSVKQHRGHCNSIPPATSKALANRLVKFLNHYNKSRPETRKRPDTRPKKSGSRSKVLSAA
jgi:hypothetical protein